MTIVETEAYLSGEDAASHAFPGPTRRNRSMFGEVARAYIYFSYGMHLCFNIVAHEPEQAGAVLVRAATVVEGRETAVTRRGRATDLANGPGKLAQALALSLDLDGTCLLEGPIRLLPPTSLPKAIARGPRVGISKAVDLPLRFWISDSPDVSKGKPGPATKKRTPKRVSPHEDNHKP